MSIDPFDFHAVAAAQRAEVDADMQYADAQAASATQYAQQCARVRGIARSTGGEVQAECDSDGRLTALRFSPQAPRLGAQALSDLTTRTIVEASRQAAAQVLRLTEQTYGAGDPFTVALRVHNLDTQAPDPSNPESSIAGSTNGRPDPEPPAGAPSFIIGR